MRCSIMTKVEEGEAAAERWERILLARWSGQSWL